MAGAGIGYHTEAAGAGIDCRRMVAVEEDRLEASSHLLEGLEADPDHNRLVHHTKVVGDQVGMVRLKAGMGDLLLLLEKAGSKGKEHSVHTHLVGPGGKEDCCNPVGSFQVVGLPDNFLETGSEPDIPLERRSVGCSLSCPVEVGSDSRNLGIGEACQGCLIEVMERPCRNMLHFHLGLPWLLDHGCESRSRSIRMSCRGRREHRGRASLLNLLTRQTPCGCDQL